jgi:hypothetical protein
MRNKWFVGGILVPAIFFTWLTIYSLRGSMGIFSVLPAAIAIGLYIAAWKISQAQSFSPQGQTRFDSGTSEAVKRWNRDRDARDAAAKKAAVPSNKV